MMITMSGRMKVKGKTLMPMFVGVGWKYSGVKKEPTIKRSKGYAGRIHATRKATLKWFMALSRANNPIVTAI
jgi:hypothetical protein